MRCLTGLPLLLVLSIGQRLTAQEAPKGVELRATLTMESVASNEVSGQPRSGSPIILAARSIAYPTIKFNENWFVTGAVQFATRPYFYQDLSTTGYGAKARAASKLASALR